MRLAVCLAIVLMLTVSTATAGENQLPTPGQIFGALGYTDEEKRAVIAGEIIAIDQPAVIDNQLKGAVAMRVPVSIDRVAGFFQGGRHLTDDPTVTAFRVLRPSIGENDWHAVRFGAEDRREVKMILKGNPVSILNLSSEEAATLKDRLNQVTAEQPEANDVLSEAYRDILAVRYRSYLEKGLDGIPPYARGGGGHASPAGEIRADLHGASFSLLDRFPTFRQAVVDFPRNQPPGVTSDFFWIKTAVEGRPHYTLAHQMTTRGDGFLLIYNRDYFTGHTYNNAQATHLWLADDRGVYAFHVNASNTDEITGFFGVIARKIGQDRMNEDLTNYFTEVRNQLTR